MADIISIEQRHFVMSHVTSQGTKPEMAARHALFNAGFRYRVNVNSLPGTPDIVLPKYRTAIFVNGCFWHGHAGCKMYTVPETNKEFWEAKVARNKERDLINNQRLESLNWSVITIWECELKPKRIDETISMVVSQLHKNKAAWESYQQHRKADRAFAIAESKRKKAIQEEILRELNETFNIPRKIKVLAEKESER